MKPFVRRSHLVVDVMDTDAVKASWTYNADAAILTMPSASMERSSARTELPHAVATAAQGAADVFVLVGRDVAYADIEAAVGPGLRGIVYPGVESGEEIALIDTWLSELEQSSGIAAGTLHTIVLLKSGAGVWNIREIVRASVRVSSVGIDELGLCRSLGIVPTTESDPFEYAKGRVVIEARAAKVQPIGMSHPYGVLPEFDDEGEIARLALRSKNLGFAGAICPDPSWVEHCNRAFAPPEDRLEFYRETRRLFAEGVARGTAAIPYPGTTMMIDVPVDENARVNLELWERCAAREAEKAAAVARARVNSH
jgi:citrate lyase subunit beta/citryl-CoA lyase